MATVLGVGLASKAFVSACTRSQTHNLPVLLDLLKDTSAGLLTYSNHISSLDDPIWCGALPASTLLRGSRFRWTLGARDIMFTNPLFSSFFRNGQVLETERRGGGIYQPSMDIAIGVLSKGGWVHLFPEGFVNQASLKLAKTEDERANRLLRFRWGISRLLLEAPTSTRVLPMYLRGFENIMPEGRSKPARYFPKFGASISLTFADQILDRRRLIDPLLQQGNSWVKGNLRVPYIGESAELKQARIDIARVLRQELIRLKTTAF